ncbi:MAG: hypothetical protein ACT4OU_03315 [Hyphomicrobium sp.]
MIAGATARILKATIVLGGVLLVIAGALLAQQEIRLVDARYATRQSEIAAGGDGLEDALKALDAEGFERADTLRLTLQASLALEARATTTPERQSARQRVLAAAAALAKAAPMDARPWCIRALAEAQSSNATAQVIEQTRSCYRYGRRSVDVIEIRVLLILSLWDSAPQDLRNAALIDVAAALSDPELDDWMVAILASAVTISPARADLAENMIGQYANPLLARYAQLRDQMRSEAAATAN